MTPQASSSGPAPPNASFGRILAVIATGVVASLVLITLPLFASGVVAHFGWSERAVGWFASADMAGSALASAVVLTCIGRIPPRSAVRFAILAAIAGNGMSLLVDSLPALLAARLFTGFGNGVVLSLVFARLCRSAAPDRYFGIYVFGQLTLQAVLLPVIPRFIEAWGIGSLFGLFATASALTLAATGSFSVRPPAPLPALPAAGSARRWGLSLLAAQALYFLAPAAIWAYFERIGAGFGLSTLRAGEALGLASLAGLAGAATVVMLGNRPGRNPSLVAGTVLSLLAVATLLRGHGFGAYLLAAALVNFSWNFTFPYQMGVIARFDRDGALAVSSLVAQLAGLSLGPALAGFLVGASGFGPMLWCCAVLYTVSLFVFTRAPHGQAPAILTGDGLP